MIAVSAALLRNLPFKPNIPFIFKKKARNTSVAVCLSSRTDLLNLRRKPEILSLKWLLLKLCAPSTSLVIVSSEIIAEKSM